MSACFSRLGLHSRRLKPTAVAAALSSGAPATGRRLCARRFLRAGNFCVNVAGGFQPSDGCAPKPEGWKPSATFTQKLPARRNQRPHRRRPVAGALRDSAAACTARFTLDEKEGTEALRYVMQAFLPDAVFSSGRQPP